MVIQECFPLNGEFSTHIHDSSEQPDTNCIAHHCVCYMLQGGVDRKPVWRVLRQDNLVYHQQLLGRGHHHRVLSTGEPHPLHSTPPPTHTHTLVENVQIIVVFQASIPIHENSARKKIVKKPMVYQRLGCYSWKLQNLPKLCNEECGTLYILGRFANFSPLRCVYELPYTPGTTARAIRISRMTGWSTAVRT